MVEKLLIVESPSKARTLQSYLGKGYKIMASVGHIKDLPKNQLGVEIEKDFQPHYQIIKGKEKIVKELKMEAAKAKQIYLAPDPDREGEAIAWHIKEEVAPDNHNCFRVLFNEITKNAILEALKNPQQLNQARYESQKARRILDRLVGYLISPILWQKVKGGLSAGRVQSVALRMVCEREREIFAFVPQEYWSLKARLQAHSPPVFSSRLIKYKGEKVDRPHKALIEEIYEHVLTKDFLVSKREKKEVQKSPPPPFITSTLQQEASKKLGYAPKKTVLIAQQLYEGIELGDGQIVGLITYMRTDSTRISEEAIAAAKSFVEKNFGREYLPKKPYTYKKKGTMQDAHEAIRPTHLEYRPEE
ncbi:MAG: type I DNA topoisomerase, partial [Desulfatiglandales bacterium]